VHLGLADLEELRRREQVKVVRRVADGQEERDVPPEEISRSW
jgi:hypothetical protein